MLVLHLGLSDRPYGNGREVVKRGGGSSLVFPEEGTLRSCRRRWIPTETHPGEDYFIK